MNGRFCVQLPFNNKISELGNSRELAIKRWHSVERRLANNKNYQVEYSKFMKEYIQLGHMSYIPRREVTQGPSYYLPHHFVVKPDSTTTKFRVVFDGNGKSTTGLSLNDCVKVGATLQDDIFSLLLRFRQHKIAIKADIAKMFRQFLVDEKHCEYQRIVYRENPTDPIQDFKLLTITYGTACAPFLSTRCLIQLAYDNKSTYPQASYKLEKDTYVDDIMTGGETVEEVKQLVSDLQAIMSSACLELRKWSSSNDEIRESIPMNLRESQEPLSFDRESNVKALGIQWNAVSDTFSFNKPDIDTTSPLTKREVLSQLAKVFDPLGFLSPVTINAKLFMQRLWKCELNWDDKLSEELIKQWVGYQDQLKFIEDISIPRYSKTNNLTNIQLHGFSDASEKAYGAVIYMRCKNTGGNYSTTMLASKSRVAPLKSVSLPRLELCGALLLSELMESVRISLDIQCEIYAWTDSMIVLQWLASHPGRWQTFIANRVSKIQEIIPYSQWNHVRSEQNPADQVSRGVTASSLKDSKLWWSGPDWLLSDKIPEKVIVSKSECAKLLEEKKKPIFISHILLHRNIIEHYSSLFRLQRAVAYLVRFKMFVMNKSVISQPLQPTELQSSLVSIVKLVQQDSFPMEYEQLKSNQTLNKRSKLLALNPIMDSDGVIRVGGRLGNANMAHQVKHPIILPHDSHLTTLIIRNAHINNMHAGNKLTWCILRNQYWIINARNTIRFFIRKCVTCRRFRAQSMTQLMGDLPPSRVNPGRPFLETGVDYAGPFNLRVMKGRSNKLFKGYMCIFICMATKAVHIEAVSDLTTDAFLASFNRFISRRGVPVSMRSDCGTNFIGADKELKNLLSNDDHNRAMTNHLSPQQIQWHFNPPSSPHQGGLWEAAVKSAKTHLKRVVGNQTLTFEEFATILCQIEACLNSRPIGALTADPDDFDVLTPGHFLIGQPLVSIPSPDLTTIKVGRLSRWQLTEQMVQHVWRRWQVEYVSTLQQRGKWQTKGRNINVGDLCVLIDDNLPPTKWKLVRVTHTHSGHDNLIRSVTIKTIDGSLKRPITKLSPILLAEEQVPISISDGVAD